MILALLLALQDDVADVPSKESKAGGRHWFLIGEPKEKQGLVVILPGGNGSAEFHTFCRRIWKNALGDKWLAAELVATGDENVVWPTEKTVQHIEETVEEVTKTRKIDPARVFTLSWSSGGPAAYAASTRKKRLVKGSLVAMSVFKPEQMDLKAAKGHAYYLLHSPEDRICPYPLAEQAVETLKRNGAKVELEKYDGGHGWRGDVYDTIGRGIEWLEKNR